MKKCPSTALTNASGSSYTSDFKVVRVKLGFKMPPKEKWVERLVKDPNYMEFYDE